MSKTLTFGNTIVDIPTSAQAPNWAEGVVDAFTAIADTLAAFAGPFDIPPQIQIIDTSNPGVPNTDITSLSFPTSSVRAVDITYSVFRSTTGGGATTVYETGHIVAIYSPSNSIGNKWEMSQDRVGDGQIAFNITDLGQVQFTATIITGSSHTGKIAFQAKAILQS